MKPKKEHGDLNFDYQWSKWSTTIKVMLQQNHGLAPKPSRIDGIDVLRGLSIFFVLMNHVHMRLWLSKLPYTEGIPAQLISTLVWSGQRGVQIFFCISGFLIASTSIRRWGPLSKISVCDFYLFRMARIAPLFLTLLVLLSALHLLNLEHFSISEKNGGLTTALISALTFRINVHEAHLGYLPPNWDVLWSLSVEEVFYLFFPLVCVFLGRSRFLYSVLMVFIVLGPLGRTVFANGNSVWAEYSYLGSMDAISLGVLTALLATQKRFSPKTLRILSFLGIGLFIFLLGFSRTIKHWGVNQLGLDMTLLALGTCMILLVATQSRWQAPRILYPLLKLGERSYEIYLTHMFVIFAYFQVFLKFDKSPITVFFLYVASIITSALLGELVGRFFSDPMNLYLRKIVIPKKIAIK